ncbi:hypothetical protein POX_d05467 [Penicillium oxalicum]|uniref:Uncharacterized protein n=1 Tax=Penicillium oxalicum (strain 114-2 / CGMCC 5302) TaxID=933388 RepID=S7ZUF3_PENO1|nr:hypothetical protein POX_d05467 [Penicillium oxalicum]EPS32371.1 hypothetical protein PDE_07331 [Penicillium oxalicum 114-2]KAI2789966.1 hypothetical protein POX_d05467 [Penicillium oxalicum]
MTGRGKEQTYIQTLIHQDVVDKDFFQKDYLYVPFQEYQMTPELASYLATEVGRSTNVSARHDVYQECMWKLGTILYGILHGHWP